MKTSLIDYPGKLSAIIFTTGCNFRCPYCHNPELVLPEKFLPAIPEQEILSFLRQRRKYLDAVTVTGGEPCIQHDLQEFLGRLKEMGYLVKLDTNGSIPDMLKDIIEARIVDYIAMDVKAPAGKYKYIAGIETDIEKIKKSISLILNCGQAYEFKTTVVKGLLQKDDFEEIGSLVKGARLLFLQKFKGAKTVDLSYLTAETFSDEEFKIIKRIMENYVSKCIIR